MNWNEWMKEKEQMYEKWIYGENMNLKRINKAKEYMKKEIN